MWTIFGVRCVEEIAVDRENGVCGYGMVWCWACMWRCKDGLDARVALDHERFACVSSLLKQQLQRSSCRSETFGIGQWGYFFFAERGASALYPRVCCLLSVSGFDGIFFCSFVRSWFWLVSLFERAVPLLSAASCSFNYKMYHQVSALFH